MNWIEGNRPTPDGLFKTVRIAVDGTKIVDIREFCDAASDLPMLYSGFVDVHVHGGGGADTMDATSEAFAHIAETHARHGTTALLLTTVSARDEEIHDVLTAVAAVNRESIPGARIAGVHLEGPFMHPERAGAQRKDRIIGPDLEMAARWFASGVVKMITLAPEITGATTIAMLAASQGIVASIGHTQVRASQMASARLSGFSHLTHLCNAMPPIHHREIGPIGYVMTDNRYSADMIIDGIHLDEKMVNLLVKTIGSDRLLLITDAMRATGVGNGNYDLGGLAVTVRDGACRLTDGTLAGSVLTMDRAVQLVQKFARISPFEAQKMASENPACKIGLVSKGQLTVGHDADICAVNPEGEILWTMIEGQIAYRG